MTDLTSLSPVEIDTKLAEIYERAYKPFAVIAETRKTIRRYQRANYKVPEYLVDRLAKAEAERADIVAEAEPYNVEFSRRGGWARFFLVPDGHVHYRHCHTLHPTTQVGWIPELAAHTEDEMVAKFGHVACTVCFPSAPLHPHFIKTAAEATKAEQAKAQTKCPSGYDYDNHNFRYGHCRKCGKLVALTSTGLMRSHKSA